MRQDGEPLRARLDLLEKLELFGHQIARLPGQAREVAAGPGQARHESCRHGIAEDGRDDGDGSRRLQGSAGRRGAGEYDHIDLEAHELTRQARMAPQITLRPAALHDEARPFHPA